MAERRSGRKKPIIAVCALLLAALSGCAQERASRATAYIHDKVTRVELLLSSVDTSTIAAARRPLSMVNGRRESGPLILADFEGRRIALVADEDEHALLMFDARDHARLGTIELAGIPSQLVIGGDGRLYVSLRNQSRVQVLEADAAEDNHRNRAIPLRTHSQLTTATEPIAMAVTTDGKKLLVTAGWGRRLHQFDLETHRETVNVKLPAEPRSITVSTDGEVAFVAHALGSSVTRVVLRDAEVTPLLVGGTDAVGRMPTFHVKMPPHWRLDQGGKSRFGGGGIPRANRHAAQGFAIAAVDDKVIAPMVLVQPGMQAVGGYGTSVSFPDHQPVIAMMGPASDEVSLRASARVFSASTHRGGVAGGEGPSGCLLPRAIAIDEVREIALVSCLGVDRIDALQLTSTPLSRSTVARWKVASGPVGVVVDSDVGEALVWSQYARTLSALTLPGMPKKEKRFKNRLPDVDVPIRATKVASSPHHDRSRALSTAAARGRVLFHAAGDTRISRDGRACASCHPDGREDGITWPTPNGRRQTPMLAGRLGEDTAPYGWQGESKTVATHVKHTFRRLGGEGVRDADLKALMAYLLEMAGPPSAATQPEQQLVTAGKKLFDSETVGCATCHVQGTGSDGNRHRVGSGPSLDTPSLRHVAGSAPYFHDGRYATLKELLRETKGKMGWAPEMNDGQLEALEAYLLTL